MSREELNALRLTVPDLPTEAFHFYECPACGQQVDRRELGDVLHHEEQGHDPILPEPKLVFLEPMLPTLVGTPPEGDDWQHEIKYDGYRTQLVIGRSRVRGFTRNGHDWTDRYEPVVATAAELTCTSAIIDGEMIVQDEQGRSDFKAYQAALGRRPEAFVFMAFDLLQLNGRDLRRQPLMERRLALRDLVGCHDPGCRIQFSEHVVGDGGSLFEASDRMGLEGIVSKRMRSRYRSGRSRDWLKVKCFAEDEFVVIGVERGTGPATALLAREVGDALEYAGSAFVTLSGPQRERFWRSVEELPIDKPCVTIRSKAAQWLAPRMKVGVKYLKGSDKLRHATLTGLRYISSNGRCG